ncbi:MAG: tetraacyldisaccharide 4'-kinase, partial [Myxococcota bacterium]
MLFPGPLGAPFAPLYQTITSVRRLAYDRDWISRERAAHPTFSVGGLEVGGTGKTPITRWLLKALLRAGYRPGLLTRGYGRESSGLQLHEPGASADPARLGDEPALIAAEVPVPIAVCADRFAGAQALGEQVNALVLDDGFSHRRLHRDLDVVALRSERGPETLHHLPWGPLRESVKGLGRADVFWLHGEEGHEQTSQALGLRFPEILQVRSTPRLIGAGTLAGRSVALVTAIARPERVERSLSEAEVHVVERLAFPDHHRFNSADLERIEVRSRGLPIVCTAKDAVKLSNSALPL